MKTYVDVIIDGLTECLYNTHTNQTNETEYRKRDTSIMKHEYNGWNFDWSLTEANGYEIYELFVIGDDTIQGRISVMIDGGVAHVDIVEVAPHNYSAKGKYIGTGAHLFAIACLVSVEAGCDGFVSFISKHSLIDHYKETLGAKLQAGQRQRMFIDEEAADVLIQKYIRK